MPRNLSAGRAIWSILVVLMIGMSLRVPSAIRDMRFQVDEALYATIARQVTLHHDLYLINTIIDKPPLLFWAMGSALELFGVNEFAARLPNVAASLVTLALIYALAKRLYPDWRVSLIATLLLAVSPFDRAFAATAFTDPLLTMFVLGGCVLALYGRWRLAGLALALAFATKPSALQWIPLTIALAATQCTRWQRALRGVLDLATGFAIGFAPLIIWSATRAVIPDFWALNLHNNNPERFIRAEELSPRLTAWLGWLNTIAPLPVIGWLSAPIQVIRQNLAGPIPFRSLTENGTGVNADGPLNNPKSMTVSRAIAIDLILTTYTLGSLALWWLVAFPVYDRYLHTLAPLMLLLCARVLVAVWNRLPLPFVGLAMLVLCMPLTTAQLAVAGDPAEFTGIDHLAAVLNTLPIDTMVYDHSLGWELGYYLGPKPPIRLIWQSTVDDLISSIKFHTGYWVAPRQESDTWLYLLRGAGIKTVGKPLYADTHFVLLYLTL